MQTISLSTRTCFEWFPVLVNGREFNYLCKCMYKLMLSTRKCNVRTKAISESRFNSGPWFRPNPLSLCIVMLSFKGVNMADWPRLHSFKHCRFSRERYSCEWQINEQAVTCVAINWVFLIGGEWEEERGRGMMMWWGSGGGDPSNDINSRSNVKIESTETHDWMMDELVENSALDCLDSWFVGWVGWLKADRTCQPLHSEFQGARNAKRIKGFLWVNFSLQADEVFCPRDVCLASSFTLVWRRLLWPFLDLSLPKLNWPYVGWLYVILPYLFWLFPCYILP